MTGHAEEQNKELARCLESLGDAWAAQADPGDDFVQRFEARLSIQEKRPRATVWPFTPAVRWTALTAAMAACLALAIALSSFGDGGIGTIAYGEGQFLASRTLAQSRLADNSALTTGDSGRALATLDNERIAVFINQNSSLRLISNEKVNLTRGEVWINVEENSGYFAVETPDCVVEVHGTTFGVRIGENGTEVALASGEVWLSRGNDYTVMGPGTIGKIAKDSDPTLMQANGDLVPRWALDLYAKAEADRAAEFFPSASPGGRGRGESRIQPSH